MTTLHVTYPPRHPRENPSLYQIGEAIADHLHVRVQLTDTFPGPRFVIPAPVEDVRAAAALYLDGAFIEWRTAS